MLTAAALGVLLAARPCAARLPFASTNTATSSSSGKSTDVAASGVSLGLPLYCAGVNHLFLDASCALAADGVSAGLGALPALVIPAGDWTSAAAALPATVTAALEGGSVRLVVTARTSDLSLFRVSLRALIDDGGVVNESDLLASSHAASSSLSSYPFAPLPQKAHTKGGAADMGGSRAPHLLFGDAGGEGVQVCKDSGAPSTCRVEWVLALPELQSPRLPANMSAALGASASPHMQVGARLSSSVPRWVVLVEQLGGKAGVADVEIAAVAVGAVAAASTARVATAEGSAADSVLSNRRQSSVPTLDVETAAAAATTPATPAREAETAEIVAPALSTHAATHGPGYAVGSPDPANPTQLIISVPQSNTIGQGAWDHYNLSAGTFPRFPAGLEVSVLVCSV